MSILDYKQPTLCTEIWNPDNTLIFEVREFILKSVEEFFKNDVGNEKAKYAVLDIIIGSSLATYYYRPSTDLDIKLIINEKELSKYIKIQPDKGESICDALTKKGRSSFYLSNVVPGTLHNLDPYFYTDEEFYPIHQLKYDSIYSFNKSGWIKEPVDIFEGEQAADAILNVAWYRAQPYIEIITKDITQASKDIVDFMMFKEYVAQLDNDDLHKVYDLFMEKYNAVNESLNDLIQDRIDLKYLRTEAFSKDTLNTELEKAMQSLNYSDGNLVFKVMQRYGLMNILTSVRDKMDADGLNVNNVNEYLSIIR